jgi:hypothetical protein
MAERGNMQQDAARRLELPVQRREARATFCRGRHNPADWQANGFGLGCIIPRHWRDRYDHLPHWEWPPALRYRHVVERIIP